jgi:hypothetical protein
MQTGPGISNKNILLRIIKTFSFITHFINIYNHYIRKPAKSESSCRSSHVHHSSVSENQALGGVQKQTRLRTRETGKQKIGFILEHQWGNYKN